MKKIMIKETALIEFFYKLYGFKKYLDEFSPQIHDFRHLHTTFIEIAVCFRKNIYNKNLYILKQQAREYYQKAIIYQKMGDLQLSKDFFEQYLKYKQIIKNFDI